MNILIVGASGAIGSALLRKARLQFPDAVIWATYRNTQPAAIEEDKRVIWVQLDLAREEQIEALAGRIDKLDWLINCVGLLHNERFKPEKSIAAFNADFFIENMQVNALASLLLGKHFTPVLKRSPSPRFAVISAKVGSIEDNRLGGWYSYRATKAALNMAIKTLAIEWRRIARNGVVLALHPGTTDSELSKPFQSNVPEGKLFKPDRVADDLFEIIQQHEPEESGQFIAYDGAVIPW